MLAFVDTEPADQLKGRRRHWPSRRLRRSRREKVGSPLRNNIGYALYQLGRYDEALTSSSKRLYCARRAKTYGQHRALDGRLDAARADRTDEALKYNCGWSVSAKPPERRARMCSRSWSCSIAPRAIESVPIITPS